MNNTHISYLFHFLLSCWHTKCYRITTDKTKNPLNIATFHEETRGREVNSKTRIATFLLHLYSRYTLNMHSLLKYTILFFIAFLCTILLPEKSMALQTHSAPEGIYVHQMAHILYMTAMCYLYWDTKRSTFSGRGWTYLRIFCVFTILWNLLALIGHASAQQLHPDDFTVTGGYLASKINMPITFIKIVFYTAKLDHLLAVPGMFFLYMGLRSFYKNSLEEEGK